MMKYLPFLAQPLRYLIFAGVVYLIFYIWRRNAWKPHKNQPKYPENSKVWLEIKYSMITSMIFGSIVMCMFWWSEMGITLVYDNISDYGIAYFLFSVIVITFIHDTYFYWTHRLMHHPKLYKSVHLIHHTSHNPTPWAAFAFHPLEAIIEIAFAPILIFIMPTHFGAWIIFLFYMMYMNVMGHSGFEYYPKWFLKNKILKYYTTPTHHNMHHQFVHKNYGLYFNFWDKIMGTNHEKYEETFEKVAEGIKEILQKEENQNLV